MWCSQTLQNDIKAFQKKAKKDRLSKQEAEARMQQMEADVKRRHEEELEAIAAEEDEDKSTEADTSEAAAATAPAAPAKPALTQPTKAQRRRENKKKQERERRERIEEENKHTVSERQVEADIILAKLARHGLVIKDIPSDGHCMYHAVADQLQRHNVLLPSSDVRARTISRYYSLY